MLVYCLRKRFRRSTREAVQRCQSLPTHANVSKHNRASIDSYQRKVGKEVIALVSSLILLQGLNTFSKSSIEADWPQKTAALPINVSLLFE